MGKKVFISYSHKQADWIRNSLVPCLKWGGADVYLDQGRLEAGKSIYTQLDNIQDKAEMNILVFSPDYLQSKYCLHEMNRAIDKDPRFQNNKTIPILRIGCNLPEKIKSQNPLYVDLQNDKDCHQWEILTDVCDANLGIPAPDWLSKRNEILNFLKKNQSVNLVVYGNPKWEELLKHIQEDFIPDIGIVDLESGATVNRRGLVEEILRVCCNPTMVPPGGEELVVLDRMLNKQSITKLIIKRFHYVSHRNDYGLDLFCTLRNLIRDKRKLLLLVQSRQPVAALLPSSHPISTLELQLVELKGII